MNVYLEYEGKPVPANDLSWGVYSPCGCQCGVIVVQCGTLLIPDEETAWKEYFESAAIRKREKERGYSFKLLHRKDSTIGMGGKCTHTPRWGIPDETAPEGFAWGRKRNAKLLHLVPLVGHPKEAHYLTAPTYDETIGTRCGQENYSWEVDRWLLSEYLTCRKCVEAIQQLEVAA